jgi:hypothetical protein
MYFKILIFAGEGLWVIVVLILCHSTSHTTGKLGKPQWPRVRTGISKEIKGFGCHYDSIFNNKCAPVIYKFYPFVSTYTYVRNKNVCRRYPSYYRNVYDLINQKWYRVSNTTRDCRPSIF